MKALRDVAGCYDARMGGERDVPITGQLTVCAAHGLRYDPSSALGCVLCQRVPSATSFRVRPLLVLVCVVATGIAFAALERARWFGARPAVSAASSGRPPAGDPDTLQVLDYTDSSAAPHSAVLFAPPLATGASAAPLMLLLDPSGSATGIVTRWRKAAKHHGWLLASSPAVRNGTPDENDRRELISLLAFMRTKFRVDARRVFSSGFSGCACGAYRLAVMEPDLIRGAVVENGHMGSWREVGDRAQGNLMFFLFTRTSDFNAPATRTLQEKMQEKGFLTTYFELPGGHEPMTADDLEAPLRWIEENARD